MVRMEEENNITTPPAVDLPPLPEMIMTAIETLNDNTGSEKSTIQKHIESTHSPLPDDFSDSFSLHLDELKQNGQLLLVNDRFKKPDSAPPLRRGRGRPPKPKPALPSGYVVPPARPRGRPPKPRDPLAPPPPPPLPGSAGGGSGRKRGRPPKADKVSSPAANGERRGRGRPPKVRAPVVVPVGS